MGAKKRQKLTKTAIDALKFDGSSQDITWDTEITNLGVRVYQSGRKSFVVQFSMNGRWQIKVLDSYGVLTVDQARKRARKALVMVSDGINPVAAKKKLTQAKTVKELCNRYIEHQKTKIKTWATDEARLKDYVIPRIGSRKIDAIVLDDMQTIHAQVSEHAPYQANRVVSTCSKMFKKAQEWELFPADRLNPCKGIERNKEISRSEYMDKEDLPDLIAAIDEEKDPYIRSFFVLALLTGLRRGEILNIKWDDIERQGVYLPYTKSGEPRYVPLSQAALDVINQTPKMLKNAYLLPGHVRGKPLCNVDKPWRRIRDKAGLPRLRIHDLRRTAGSWMLQDGSSIHAVKDVLGHKKTVTTEIYARLSQKQPRDAIEGHGRAFLEAAKGNGRGQD